MEVYSFLFSPRIRCEYAPGDDALRRFQCNDDHLYVQKYYILGEIKAQNNNVSLMISLEAISIASILGMLKRVSSYKRRVSSNRKRVSSNKKRVSSYKRRVSSNKKRVSSNKK